MGYQCFGLLCANVSRYEAQELVAKEGQEDSSGNDVIEARVPLPEKLTEAKRNRHMRSLLPLPKSHTQLQEQVDYIDSSFPGCRCGAHCAADLQALGAVQSQAMIHTPAVTVHLAQQEARERERERERISQLPKIHKLCLQWAVSTASCVFDA